MCIEYSGGLTYRDGCRKKEMEAPLITCKLRPFGRSGKPGDARMCKNYFFVKFGWHRIWTLACPEHWDDEVLGLLEEYEEEDVSDVITELDLNMVETRDTGSFDYGEPDSEYGDVETDMEYSGLGFQLDRTPKPRDHTRNISDTTTSSSQSSLHPQNMTRNDWFGTWPSTAKHPESRTRHRRKSLSSVLPVRSKPSMKSLVPTFSRTSKESQRSDNSVDHRDQVLDEDTATPRPQARFVTQLPPKPFRDRGKGNRPRAHTRNKSAQVLGLEDPVVEEMGRERAILSGLGISC